MKKNIYLVLAIFLSLSVITLTSCFPTDKSNNENSNTFSSYTSDNTNKPNTDSTGSSDNVAIDIPEHITNSDIDTLNIDADVYSPDGDALSRELSSAEAKCRIWNGEVVISELMANNLINEKNIVESTSGENSGPEDMYYNYKLENGTIFTFNTGGVMYRTQKYRDLSYSYYIDFFGNTFKETMVEAFGTNEIASLNKEKAIEDSKKILAVLDMDKKVGDAEIYSMTSDKVKAILEITGATLDKYEQKIEPYTEDNNAYLIVYPVEYNKIPSSQIMAFGENELLERSRAFFVYSKDGIIGFEISGIFDEENYDESRTLISPLEACDVLKNHFDSMIIDSPTDISDIRLVFICRRNFFTGSFTSCKVEPIWMLQGITTINKGDQEFEDIYISYISALSGEIIPISSIGG